jgi:hypothetical protein
VGQIVRRDGDRHAITGDDLDVEASEAPTDAGEERMTLVTLHAEVTAREGLYYFALNLNEIVSCHSKPFCLVPPKNKGATARFLYQRD